MPQEVKVEDGRISERAIHSFNCWRGGVGKRLTQSRVVKARRLQTIVHDLVVRSKVGTGFVQEAQTIIVEDRV